MKRKQVIALLASVLAASTALQPISTLAVSTNVTETQQVSENTTATTDVTIDGGDSTFTVTVPKKMAGTGESGTLSYTVEVEGDIAGDQHVFAVPDEKVVLKQAKKSDVDASITQDKTEWVADEFATVGNGLITYNGLSAGTWEGIFNFNVGIADDTPAGLVAGLYGADDVLLCELTPEDFNGEYGGSAYDNLPESKGIDEASVAKVVIPEGTTSIGHNAFSGCTSLTSVTIPNSVTSIDYCAFSSCTSLTSVTIPDSVTSIGNSAFNNCTSLTSVTIPSSVTSISVCAFSGCTNLTPVTIPDSVTSISDNAFKNVPHIYYNGTATGSPWGALSITRDNSHIPVNVVDSEGTNLNASASLITGEKADELLAKLVESGNITSADQVDLLVDIKTDSFDDISTATFDVSSIASEGEKVAIIHYNETTSEWEYFGVEVVDSTGKISGDFTIYFLVAFVKVTEEGTLGDVIVKQLEVGLYDADGNLLAPLTAEQVQADYSLACNLVSSLGIDKDSVYKVVIPEGTTRIGNYAFKDCNSITSVTIPDSVTEIDYWVFWGCRSLSSITIPDSVTMIGTRAFCYCTSLTSVSIPDSVTSIGVCAFYECTSLTSVTIPDSVTSIGGNAFSCTSLTSVTIPDSVTSIGDYAFDDVPHIYYNGTATGSPWGAQAIN